MSKKVRKCVLCGKPLGIGHYGNNPAPLAREGVCCDKCNEEKVLPARLAAIAMDSIDKDHFKKKEEDAED